MPTKKSQEEVAKFISNFLSVDNYELMETLCEWFDLEYTKELSNPKVVQKGNSFVLTLPNGEKFKITVERSPSRQHS
jgi:hypothetical protein